jgi:hypothetical protein
MAYTVEITKGIPMKLNEDDYTIPIDVVIKDESLNTVLEKEYSERWYSGLSVGVIKVALQNKIKADWDTYVAEQDVYNAVAFDTMVDQIETALDTYINT